MSTYFQVAALAKRGILDNSVFMRKCLLPALHISLSEKLWPSVLLWLQTVELFMETLQCDMNHACLLVVMAQVIEASQFNISTFSLEVVHAHEKAVHLVNMLVDILDVSNSTQGKIVCDMSF
ncbi:hypothetical protein PR048_021933 [Dryococelus australis]|uniref:Uncharacterized protein n=1 Tax=Dryococelus australis TaxID=614101 RepID=A0ABQ9GZT4_9NEOP|nr:hypothetical protein PR048_021933 [Dryococelus australis]